MEDEIVKVNDKIIRAFEDLLDKTDKKRPKKEDVKALRKMLSETLGLWRIAGDLAWQARRATISKIQASEAMRSSIRFGLDAIKDDLGYQNAPELEKLLIEQVVMSWLRMNLTEYNYTNIMMGESISLPWADYWERRLGAAQWRYLRACETLVRVRKLIRRTPALQVNIATEGGQQINVA
ncbi:hypothetical protein KAX17_08940 [Candidatus Bipolaricaulota bacterium]|nr:hypothetical protein [Candidatus Bipolaricaulota bacterium]